ncbi:MAG: hypothetical protein K2X67_04255 [Burkholderiales bacterium]|jgi:hypothetical protein|nr:hypothetical protein [Burkholderiales bacterium]
MFDFGWIDRSWCKVRYVLGDGLRRIPVGISVGGILVASVVVSGIQPAAAQVQTTVKGAAAAYYFNATHQLVGVEAVEYKSRQIKVDQKDGLQLILNTDGGVCKASTSLVEGDNKDVIKDLKAVRVVYLSLVGDDHLAVLGVESLEGMQEGGRVIKALPTIGLTPACCCSLLPGPRGPFCPCATTCP